uniref:Uncharacterized protein n=1 Tax=Globisporangium ultimum (strain ATCC 200006 / CBS 805.95 / DAOM BR144) TaxID=431595 RepID=K3WHN2_GLOUD
MALAAADVDGSARNASTSRQGAASPQQQRGRVVTTSVMLLSLIYFLVFKWLFNIIFSTIPLMFWAIALAQVVPLDGGVTADLDVANGNVAKYFVAVAIGFLAHQIGVTAASCNVFISEKMTDFLFEEATRADNGDNSYAPLLHWNSGRGEIPTNAYQYHSALNSHSTFDARPYEERRPPMTSAQSMSAAHQSSFSNGNVHYQQTRRRSTGVSISG